MATSVHEFTDDTGVKIKIAGRTRQEALNLLRNADPAMVERALRVSEKGGLTPQDVTAMLGGQGYKGDAKGMTLRPGGFDTGVGLNETAAEGLVGAGRTFDAWGTGAQQLLPDVVKETLGVQSDAELAAEEQTARSLFQQLDNEGFGAEDIGQALPQVLAFMGGGSIGAGWKALMARGGLTGAAEAGLNATAEGESRASNTAIGAVVGAAAPLLGMVPSQLAGLVGSSGKAAVNWLGTLVASSKGNLQTAIFTTSRAMSAANAAANQARAAAQAAAKSGMDAPGVRTAQLIAQRAQSTMGKIIAGMHGAQADNVAYQAANEAFEAGFDASSGVLKFNPAAAATALARIYPRNVKEFGEVGRQLMVYKQFVNAMQGVDDLDPATIKNAASWIMAEPDAASLVKTVQDTIDPAVKRSLIHSLIRSSAFGTAAGGSNALVNQASEPDVEGM